MLIVWLVAIVSCYLFDEAVSSNGKGKRVAQRMQHMEDEFEQLKLSLEGFMNPDQLKLLFEETVNAAVGRMEDKMQLMMQQTFGDRIQQLKCADTHRGSEDIPMTPTMDYVGSTLTRFKLGGQDSDWQSYSDYVTNFLKYGNYSDCFNPNTNAMNTDKKCKILYDTKSGDHKVRVCPHGQKWANDEYVCDFEIKMLGNWCTKENNFGYKYGKPCVLIKLNKVYNWKPELYESIDDFPSELKENLDLDLLKVPNNTWTRTEPADLFNKVWLTCQGENPADKENMGNIKYHPGPFFFSHYYPYKNEAAYNQPLVAVEFEGPANGVLINIECKAWAKNMEHIRSERIGSVHFELLID